MIVLIFKKSKKKSKKKIKKNQQKKSKKNQKKITIKEKVVRYFPQLMALHKIRIEIVFVINMVSPDARFFYPV